MNKTPLTWVCFAVRDEARFFLRRVAGREGIRVVLTGMGRRNAEQTVSAALKETRPHWVISSGFAGGLKPGLESDALGLFVGNEFAAEETSLEPFPGQIILFLANLRAQAEGDEAVYSEEVRTTYLHELGHYLGLDEEDLFERGLE